MSLCSLNAPPLAERRCHAGSPTGSTASPAYLDEVLGQLAAGQPSLQALFHAQPRLLQDCGNARMQAGGHT